MSSKPHEIAFKIAKLAVVGSSFRRFGSHETATMAEIHDIGGFIMAAQTSVSVRPSVIEQTDHVLLRRTLIADTLMSGVSGLALVLFSNPIETLLGGSTPELLVLLGFALLAFAAFTGTTAREVPLNRTKAWAIFWANIVWVDASLLLLATNVFNLSTTGNIIILVAAFGVADFAFFEWLGLRRGKSSR
jgi:hypothetical protein